MTRMGRGLIAALVAWLGMAMFAAVAQESKPSQYYFKVERLNPGLPTKPDVNRETPQAAVESFLFHARDGDFASAAHVLDLGAVSEAEQAWVGPELARQLEEIIRRKVWVDWNLLPDRPDGLDVAASSKDPLSGEPRRSLRLGLVDMDGRPVPVRLARLKPSDGDPVWVFAAQTVENIPGLHRLYGKSALEKALPGWLKLEVFSSLALWELVALPLLLAAAATASYVVYRTGRRVGDALQPRLAGRLVSGISLPVALLCGALLAYLVSKRVLVFSIAIDTFLKPLLLFALFGGGLLIAVRIIDLVIDKTLTNDVSELEKPENREMRVFQTNLSAFRRVGIVVLVVLVAGLLLTQINVFATTGLALVGSAGVVTLILAFAGRAALSNIMASLQIAMSKAASIGDSLLFEDQWCYVEKINFTYVQLKTWDNRRLIVPVSYFVSEPFENWTMRDASMTKTFELRLDHTADVDALRERFEEFVDGNEKVVDRDEARVMVVGHDASGMLVRFYAPAGDPSSGWLLHCELREAMLKAVTELDLERAGERRFLPVEREVQAARERGSDAQRNSDHN